MRIRAIRPVSKQTADPTFMEYSVRLTKSYASPGTEVDVVFPEAGAHAGPMVGHINEARIMSSAPYVIREVIRAEEEGFDAAYLTGEYDVGGEIARHMVKIPVVDTGPAVIHTAALLGDRLCLITIEDSLRAYTRKLLRRWGLSDFVTSLKAWNIPVSEVWHRKDEVKDLTIKICREAVEREDANVIVPLCGVFIPMITPPEEIEAAIGVPVVNTLALGLRLTELFVNLKLHKSEKVYPPTPYAVWAPEKVMAKPRA